MRKQLAIRAILSILCGVHLLVFAYLVITIPSIPTVFADEAWVVKQIPEHAQNGTLEDLMRAAARSSGIMEKTAISHLFALGGLSFLTAISSGFALYCWRRCRKATGTS